MAYNPVRNHPIHDTLKRLLALQNSAILTGPDSSLDEQHRWYLDKIFYLAKHASNGIRKRMQFAVSVNGLNNLQTSGESIILELGNYISNRNVTHILTAFNQSEQGFQIYMDQAIPRGNGGGSSDADDVIDSLKSSYDSAIEALKSERNKLTTQLASLAAAISTNLDSITSLEGEIEKNRSESQSVITALSANNLKLSEELETRFSDSMEAWSKDRDKAISDVSGATEELVGRISQKEIEARGLVQSVGDILTTGTYKITADKEAKLANTYRLITIALFLVGIFIVLSNYIIRVFDHFKGIDSVETPWMITTRFLTALVIALPALYTARESARHRTNADRATQRELELSSLDPFIELMPPEMKSAIRDRLTDRYFGSSIEPHKIDSPLDVDKVTKIMEVAIKSAKSI